jgi:serine/threonine protein kinase
MSPHSDSKPVYVPPLCYLSPLCFSSLYPAGTITHQAPELLEHGLTSKAADVYSFGVLLWQMLASSRWVLS